MNATTTTTRRIYIISTRTAQWLGNQPAIAGGWVAADPDFLTVQRITQTHGESILCCRAGDQPAGSRDVTEIAIKELERIAAVEPSKISESLADMDRNAAAAARQYLEALA